MTHITFVFDKKSARSLDADGRMRVKDCVLSTAEVNPYYGREIPDSDRLGLDSNKVYELYRAPDELKKAASSYEGIPLMLKHIPQTAEEPRKEYQCGAVHSITFDGKHLRGDLLVSDAYAVGLIESGELADLSCGYRFTPDMTSGSINGVRYDGVMRDLQGNHVALVDDGRASGAHVADAAFRNPQLPDPSLQGDSNMAIPEQQEAPANPEAGATPAPEAAGNAEHEASEKAGMAAIGQALKHMAGLLESIQAKLGATDTAAVDADMNEKDTLESEREGAMDFELEPAVEGEHESAMDEEGCYETGAAAEQEGTPARGNPTPHGAMDAKAVRAAVEQAVKAERLRAADVEAAKREVRGVLGEVYGMDSAGKIYREALKEVGVDIEQVKKGAERSAWQAYKAAANAAAAGRATVRMAQDKGAVKEVQSGILGHLAKISVKG